MVEVEELREELAEANAALDNLRGREDGQASRRDYMFAERIFSGWRDRLNAAEANRDHYRQHIEWAVETLERGQDDELDALTHRLRDSLSGFH